jgi:hypothetical protein
MPARRLLCGRFVSDAVGRLARGLKITIGCCFPKEAFIGDGNAPLAKENERPTNPPTVLYLRVTTYLNALKTEYNVRMKGFEKKGPKRSL